ncbi:MAG TPA: hypothetical protein VGI43_09920 [Mucilaginibacter sp.]|jgi:hypothetical protein
MASIIDPESAKSLIQEYQQQNAAPGGPANKTHEGRHLNGFFLDRASLEHLLSNPNTAGVSLYLAKHPDHVGSPENRLTLLYSGAEPNTAADASSTYVNTGPMYGGTPPCPTYC